MLLASLLLAMPAFAQDVGPALDPGPMVGWAAGNEVLRQNQRRSGNVPRAHASDAETAATCARLPCFQARYGAHNPKVVRLGELCAMLGH